MWDKLKSFLGIKDPEPMYVVVKWKLGDRWAIKNRETNRFKSLTSPGCWWMEEDFYFVPCCTSENKEDVIELCAHMNSKGTDWVEV